MSTKEEKKTPRIVSGTMLRFRGKYDYMENQD